jgi:hypothetical protein
LRGKPNLLAILGAMAAIVALPLVVLVPWAFGEFDMAVGERRTLHTTLTEQTERLERIEEAFTRIDGRFDSLTRAIAKATARPAYEDPVATYTFYPGPLRPDPALVRMVSGDVIDSLVSEDVLTEMRVISLDGRGYVFMTTEGFNQLPADLQDDLTRSLSMNEVEFDIE